jgi:uncharacterized damage-inducible protein DinB
MGNLAEVLQYLQESECHLLEALDNLGANLHVSQDGRWSPAQIVHHLVRTEQVMYPIWVVVPRLKRFPWLLDRLDQGNAALWRAMGMRTLEHGDPTLERPEEGKYRAPVFLKPVGRRRSRQSLIAWRSGVRQRSLRAILRIDEASLTSLRWSHPLLGSYTLIEMVRFLGLHEAHHLGQIRRAGSPGL